MKRTEGRSKSNYKEAGKSNTFALMEKYYYWNTLVMKHHLSTSTYEKVIQMLLYVYSITFKPLLKT